jgi:NNP family nitrate/nitrite transporter-like MFS transporter
MKFSFCTLRRRYDKLRSIFHGGINTLNAGRCLQKIMNLKPDPLKIPVMDSFRACLPVLLMLSTIFFINFLSRILLGPLLPAVELDLGIVHSQSGSLFFFISAGYFLGLAGSGFLSSVMNHRRIIISSCLVLSGTLLLIAMVSSLSVLSAALLLLGLASGIYLPSGVVTISTCVDPRNWGKAFAVHEAGPNLAFVVAPMFAKGILQWFSWRTAIGILGFVALCAGGVLSLRFKGGQLTGEAPHPLAIRALFIQPAFWITVVMFCLAISSTVGIYSMLPLYLVTERGLSPSEANTFVALSRIPTIATVFLAGSIIDRLGARTTMVLVFIYTGSMTIMLGMAPVTWISVAVFLQPLFAVCFFPAGFSMLSTIAPPQSRNIAVSLAIPIGFLAGGGLVPGVIGMLADAGMFSFGIIMVGVAIFMGCFVALLLQLERRN